ncbi:MAG: electron transfer flavoprotein subunit alpha/FixB family protein, partial [Salibacteraceae bacterium]
MNVLVFADSENGKISKASFEAATYGAKIASNNGGQSTILTYGDLSEDDLTELAAYGIPSIMHCNSITEMDPMQLSKLTEAAANEINADVVVFSHDYTGKSIAPLVSAKLKAGLVSGAIDFPTTDGDFTVKTNVFSGKAFATVKIKTDKKILTLLPNSIPKEKNEASAQV